MERSLVGLSRLADDAGPMMGNCCCERLPLELVFPKKGGPPLHQVLPTTTMNSHPVPAVAEDSYPLQQ